MKKVFSFLAVLALVVMSSSAVWAVTPFAQKTAKVTFGSAPALAFDVKIYNFDSTKTTWDQYTTEADDIGFDTSDFTFGSSTPQLKNGTTFAKISSNLSAQSAGTTVYMYTRNKVVSGDYKANAFRSEKWGSTNVTLYNGLVRKGNTAAYTTGDLAPIKIKCAEKPATPPTANPTIVWAQSEGDTGADSGVRLLLDMDDSIYSTYGPEAKVIGISGSNGGVWVGYGVPSEQSGDPYNWYAKDKDVLVYFYTQFTNVAGGDEYGNAAITFSTVTE